MTIYLTKVWGFGEPLGPLVFNMEGRRDSARKVLAPGDLVVLVGTKGEPTDPSEQGRLLGIMEPTTHPVLALDFDLPHRSRDSNEDGDYKWPFGLLNRQAWRLIDRPLLEEISDRRFNMDAASGIVPLTDEEAAKIMALHREPVKLLEPTVRTQARIEGVAAARKRLSPPPTTSRNGVMHMRRAPAYTYVMEIIGASGNAFKIGWAFDYKIRARQFNQAAMPEIGGLRYKPVLYHLWDTARQAYNMEQQLLNHFNTYRHIANHEIIHAMAYEELQAVWIRFIGQRKQ